MGSLNSTVFNKKYFDPLFPSVLSFPRNVAGKEQEYRLTFFGSSHLQGGQVLDEYQRLEAQQAGVQGKPKASTLR